MGLLPRSPSRRIRIAGSALMTTLVKGGTVVTAIEKMEADVLKATFVILRLTFASWHVMNGTEIAPVSPWLGHSRVDITVKNYAWLKPYRSAIGNMWGAYLERSQGRRVRGKGHGLPRRGNSLR